MAEEDAGDCDETKPSSYPGNLSYGGTVRSIYSGRNQFSLRNRQRLRMGSGAGREDSQSGGKTGSSLRHHSHSGSGAGYFKGFPHGKTGRDLRGRPGPGGSSGNGIYERNPDNRGRRQKTGKCGQAFSRISQFTGRYPRDKQRYAVPPHGRNIRQAFPVCDF